jgi:dihydroflavonol-4-reductase
MRVLVTGAGGFVGSHLAHRLARNGVRVRALVRAAPPDARLAGSGIELVTGDIRDEASVDAAIRGCEVVYHMAAARGRATWQECYSVNVEGTERLARAAARAGVRRFVHAGTRGVHGVHRGVLDEEAPFAPTSLYRKSKLLGEQAVGRVARECGLDVAILRLPGMMGARAGSWLGLFRAIGRGGFRVIGSGRNRQHPCHVDDAVDGLVLAGSADRPGVEAYLLGGPEPVTVNDFVHRVAAELGVRVSRVHLPAAPYRSVAAVRTWLARRGAGLPATHDYEMFLADCVIDDRKARRELGYAPTRSLETSIGDTVASFRQDGLL